MQNALTYVWIYPQQIQQKWQSYKLIASQQDVIYIAED